MLIDKHTGEQIVSYPMAYTMDGFTFQPVQTESSYVLYYSTEHSFNVEDNGVFVTSVANTDHYEKDLKHLYSEAILTGHISMKGVHTIVKIMNDFMLFGEEKKLPFLLNSSDYYGLV